MKQFIIAILLVLLAGTSAFAVGPDVTGTGAIEIGGTDANNSTLNIGLTPKVVARYFTPGTTDASAQWYAISAVHPGGTVGCGTAADVNNIYYMWHETATATTDITGNIPVVKEPAETLVDSGEVDPDTGEPIMITQAAQTWVNLGWSQSIPSGPPSE